MNEKMTKIPGTYAWIKANESRKNKVAEYKEGIYKQASHVSYKQLKKNQVSLTPEERKLVMDRKAVWHFNGGGPSPAVWKSVNPKTGETTYVTNTHRAMNTAPSVKGAIGRFHKFIKSTAAEIDEKLEKLAALNKDVKLNPFQQRIVDDPEGSKIVAHAVGSGKTLGGIAKFEKMKADGKAHKALVIVPAALRDNFGVEGVKKFTNSKYNIIGNKQEISKKQYKEIDPDADYNIVSYEMFRSNPEKYIKESGADTVITK